MLIQAKLDQEIYKHDTHSFAPNDLILHDVCYKQSLNNTSFIIHLTNSVNCFGGTQGSVCRSTGIELLHHAKTSAFFRTLALRQCL